MPCEEMDCDLSSTMKKANGWSVTKSTSFGGDGGGGAPVEVEELALRRVGLVERGEPLLTQKNQRAATWC